MADKQRAQVCRHNKDKSYRSRLTHARIRALPFDLERKPLLGEAVFFFSPLFHVPVRTFFLSTQIGRVSRRDAPASRTASVLRRSGVERKRKKKKMEAHESVDFQSPSLVDLSQEASCPGLWGFFFLHAREAFTAFLSKHCSLAHDALGRV